MKQASYDLDTKLPDLGGVRQLAGDLCATGLKLGIAVSRYNLDFTRALLEQAVGTWREQGGAEEDLVVAWVPGAYEVSSALARMADTDSWDALIGLGVVVEGETRHAELIGAQVSRSLAELARQQGLPVIDGVIPVRNVEQARARCLAAGEGRGRYFALAAIEMARLYRQLGAARS